jgi:hypothetical protein
MLWLMHNYRRIEHFEQEFVLGHRPLVLALSKIRAKK